MRPVDQLGFLAVSDDNRSDSSCWASHKQVIDRAQADALDLLMTLRPLEPRNDSLTSAPSGLGAGRPGAQPYEIVLHELLGDVWDHQRNPGDGGCAGNGM